jgi:hypothetical protein
MTQWAVVISTDQYGTERLYHHDQITVEAPAGPLRPADGDDALIVVAGEQPQVVALGRVRAPALVPAQPGPSGTAGPLGLAGSLDRVGVLGDPVVVAYTRRAFDAPVPAAGLRLDDRIAPVDAATYRDLAARLGQPADLRTWLVSVDLPIEAESPAEAVRQFWSYVRQLGPRELPTFVSPADDELAMQAFVLGEEANQDPEEDEDD